LAITLDISAQPDGWQVLHELKADTATRAIPVIVLSIVDNKNLGYRLGACDYLIKPFDRDAILATLTHVPPRQGRLLVVDDDPQVVDLVCQLLEGEPYEIISAADGQEALEVIDHRRPDVIILDLLMPRMDGFMLIEQIQQTSQFRQIPIIVLMAKNATAARTGASRPACPHGDPETRAGSRDPHSGIARCSRRTVARLRKNNVEMADMHFRPQAIGSSSRLHLRQRCLDLRQPERAHAPKESTAVDSAARLSPPHLRYIPSPRWQ
jgi:CheY-like chemotaxis protein